MLDSVRVLRFSYLIVEGFVCVQKEIFHASWDKGLVIQVFWAWFFDGLKYSFLKTIFKNLAKIMSLGTESHDYLRIENLL